MSSRNRLQQRDWMKQLQQTYNSMISEIAIHIADIFINHSKGAQIITLFSLHPPLLFYAYGSRGADTSGSHTWLRFDLGM